MFRKIGIVCGYIGVTGAIVALVLSVMVFVNEGWPLCGHATFESDCERALNFHGIQTFGPCARGSVITVCTHINSSGLYLLPVEITFPPANWMLLCVSEKSVMDWYLQFRREKDGPYTFHGHIPHNYDRDLDQTVQGISDYPCEAYIKWYVIAPLSVLYIILCGVWLHRSREPRSITMDDSSALLGVSYQ